VRLHGRRFQHVIAVHRATVGAELCVGLLNDRIGTGSITHVNESALEMDVRFDHTPPQKLALTLILALPRPKVLRRVLRAVSSMCVPRVIIVNSFRVEKSFWQSPILGEKNIQAQLVLGLEQAKDTALPEVLLRPLLKPFVEDELPSLANGALSLIAHPQASVPCPRHTQQATILAVGPEGGFLPYEIDKFTACGFTPVTIGSRILCVETVVPALIAQLC